MFGRYGDSLKNTCFMKQEKRSRQCCYKFGGIEGHLYVDIGFHILVFSLQLLSKVNINLQWLKNKKKGLKSA